jgi:pilus assembly protein FimV
MFQASRRGFRQRPSRLRFAVEKRPGGNAVVKVTSSRPINEPFLDFLVELNWPAGRLVREYTFLLDPPEIAAKQTARPVAEARVVETVRGAASAEGRQASGGMGARPSAQPGWPGHGCETSRWEWSRRAAW